ncbi:MAG: dihydrolipoamide acetyltransferase family protein [Mycobacterium sp.]|uniref:dihydrolipoamide acetyltransferase family protein n=1 Tax=Mycobacterium sp. TaxID=1785 RepID=UPI00262FDCAD|nr:dihydrolipoamide acetyltransferase family protein [Mycobacterium sp.]MDI3315198.1 dihydrolipoamide acetyltransferase family protein [Mycobacterium sp.]
MPEVLMPRLSDTMQEGVIGSWLKHEGDPVHKGDVLAEIETDKATMELEAYDEGILTRILVAEGTTVPIGTPIAVIDSAPSAPGAAVATPPTPTAPGAPAAPAPPAPVAPPPGPAPADTAVRATPLVRRLAREHGIDLATLTGSGPGGRIIRADIDKAIAASAAAPAPGRAPSPVTPAPVGADTEEIPLTRVRRITAQRLAESARQAPHFYLTRVVHADALLALRSQVNTELAAAGIKVSVTDLLVKACAQALSTHPEVNSSWDETRLLRHRRIHIGVAVAVADGLVVPVLHDADRKTLSQLSREAHTLAERARNGRLSLEEISGATFTISNLGMYGVDQFTAVINPPQAAILAVGAATQSPIVRDGRLTVGTTMALTLAIDHRVLDGAAGAQFLADLATLLQHPTRMLL